MMDEIKLEIGDFTSSEGPNFNYEVTIHIGDWTQTIKCVRIGETDEGVWQEKDPVAGLPIRWYPLSEGTTSLLLRSDAGEMHVPRHVLSADDESKMNALLELLRNLKGPTIRSAPK